MTGNVVEHDDADQEQAGAEQAEDHVARSGGRGAADLTDHQKTARGQSRDLNKHIGREDVIGIKQGQQRNLNEVN